MTFSTRIIQTGTPPASRTLRNLVMTFWLSPIMLPLAIAATSHEFIGNHIAKASHDGVSAVSITAHVLPASFLSAQIPMNDSRLMTLPNNKVARLDFRVFDQTVITAGNAPPLSKITGRAQQAPGVRPSNHMQSAQPVSGPVAVPSYASSLVDKPESGTEIMPAFGKTHTFRRAAAIGPNVIKADGVTIELAGISPTDSEAACKRIDGLVQPCTERAQHRLAILLQARNISCTIMQTGAQTPVKARCKAGNIDLATDLLRNGLVRRTASQTLASVN